MEANETPKPEHTDWRTSAACRGMEPATFFPSKGNHPGIKAALEVCAGCPVKAPCLEEALAVSSFDGGDIGIRGGTTGLDRRRLRAARRRMQRAS